MTTRDFFKLWGPEMLMTVLSFALLMGFWVIYAMIFSGQSAMVPAAGIQIFWALFKFTVFSTFGHFVTFIYCSRYSKAQEIQKEGHSHPEFIQISNSCDRETQFKVWALVVLALSLCSLA